MNRQLFHLSEKPPDWTIPGYWLGVGGAVPTQLINQDQECAKFFCWRVYFYETPAAIQDATTIINFSISHIALRKSDPLIVPFTAVKETLRYYQGRLFMFSGRQNNYLVALGWPLNEIRTILMRTFHPLSAQWVWL